MELLISKGADVNAKDKNNATVLKHSANKDVTDILKAALAASALAASKRIWNWH